MVMVTVTVMVMVMVMVMVIVAMIMNTATAASHGTCERMAHECRFVQNAASSAHAATSM